MAPLRAVLLLPWAALLLPLTATVALPEGASPRATPVVGRLQLAPEGLETSRLGIGALHFPELGSAQALNSYLHTALDNGITFIDIADIYGWNRSALLLGEAFKLEPGLREKFQILYKFGIVFPDAPVQYLDSGAAYMRRAVDIALTQLQTTYIDVICPHAPDPLLDPVEFAATAKELKQTGKIKFVGVSNFLPSQLELLHAALQKEGLVLTTSEFEASVLTPTALFDGRMDQVHRLAIAPLAWGPLGGDCLAGVNRLFNFRGDRQVRIRGALQKVAAELGPGVTEDQVAVAWLLRHPARIVPLLGTVNATRLTLQAQAVNLHLTRSQWTVIQGASASDNYKRWEQLNDGQWHDVANDSPTSTYGSKLGVDVPVGFCDFESCKMPPAKTALLRA